MLEAARLGSEWAWTLVYRDYSPMVLRYLRAHSARQPEDVLGETFVQVVRKLPDFVGGETEFRAWLFTIARSRMLDEWRRSRREPVDYVADEEIEVASAALDGAEDVAGRHIADENVRAVLNTLTPGQRDVLFLRIFSGLTIDEIAHVVGKRPGAVKQLQARGLAAIRRAISRKAVTL